MYTNTVQSLNNIDWKLFELQITLSKYCLAGTDVRTEKAIPRPASVFGDTGKNRYKCIPFLEFGLKQILYNVALFLKDFIFWDLESMWKLLKIILEQVTCVTSSYYHMMPLNCITRHDATSVISKKSTIKLIFYSKKCLKNCIN